MKKLMIIALLMTFGLAACVGGDDGGSAAPAEPQEPVSDPVITIEDKEFKNGTVTVEEGTTVTWVWEDAPVEHNVVFDDFESPLQAEGSYTHTFEEAGSFDYHCAPHPFMTGTITVVEAGDG